VAGSLRAAVNVAATGRTGGSTGGSEKGLKIGFRQDAVSQPEVVIYMTMWELKKCPRCGGDMFIDRDIYGWYEKCLQCSYCCELRGLKEIQQSLARKDKRSVGTPGQ